MVDATTNSAPPPPLARYGGMHILVYMYMYVLLSDDYIVWRLVLNIFRK